MKDKRTNKYGLNRPVPAGVRRIVRKNSGFGCVICGQAVCDYDHVDPEFVEAKEHDPDRITLLCGSCHIKKTRGLLSVAQVKRAMRHPKCKEEGFTMDAMDIGFDSPVVQIGQVTFRNVQAIVSIDGEAMLSIAPPEANGAPYRLNARFTNDKEDKVLEIKNNTWYAGIDNWDVECIGNCFICRESHGKISLKIRNFPGEKLVIERINMKYKGYHIEGGLNKFTVRTLNKTQELNFDGGGTISGSVPIQVIDGHIKIQGAQIDQANLKLKGAMSNSIIINSKIQL